MSCPIQTFKNTFGLRPDQEIFLVRDQMSEEGIAVASFMNKIKDSYMKEGFNYIENPVFEYIPSKNKISNGFQVKINQQNLDKYNSFIKSKMLEEQHITQDLEESTGLSIEELYDIEQKEGETGRLPFDGMLYSVAYPDEEMFADSEEEPSNFYQYKIQREKEAKDLEEIILKLRRGGDRKRASEVQIHLNKVQEEIKNMENLSDGQTIIKAAKNNIKILNELLDNIKNNNIDSMSALSDYNIKKRINVLSRYFRGVDIYTNEDLKEDFDYKSAMKAFEGLTKAELDDLDSSIAKLVDRYKQIQTDILINAFLNDANVKHNLETKVWSEADLERIIEDIKNRNVEIDKIGKNLLGAGSQSVVSQLLLNIINTEKNRQSGITYKRKHRLMENSKKLANKFIPGTGERITNILFQKDKNGVRTNRLISPYTDVFRERQNLEREYKKRFISSYNSETYSDWMNHNKANYEYIDITKLRAIRDKYSNHPTYGKYFKATEKEIDAYEARLKSILGDTVFEMELNNAMDSLDDFIYNSDTDSFQNSRVEERQNPFAFLENFNSDNYNKSNSRGQYLDPKFNTYIPKPNSKTDSKSTKFYNKEFFDIEKGENGKELMEIFKDSYSLLTDYIEPALASEGINTKYMELIDIEDITDNENFKTLSLGQKALRYLKIQKSDWAKLWYDAQLDRLGQTDDEITTKGKTGIRTGYRNNNKLKKDVKDIYEKKSIEELLNILSKNGYNNIKVPSFEMKNSKGEIVENVAKKRKFTKELAASAMQSEFNKTNSSDIFTIINEMSNISESIRARQTGLNVSNVIKDYLTNYKKSNTNTNIVNTSNLETFIDLWTEGNIIGNTYALEEKRFGKGKKEYTTLLATKRLGLLKKNYSESEKIVKKVFEDEMKNFKSTGELSFEITEDIDGVPVTTKYVSNKDGSASKTIIVGENQTTVPLTKSQIEEIYGKYLKDKFDSMGTHATIGSILLGISKFYFRKFLSFSMIGGYANRHAGILSSRIAASSGMYGYNLDDYNKARAFNFGVNANYYSDRISNDRVNWNNSSRGLNQQTAVQLLQSLGTVHNRVDDFANEGKSGFSKLKNKVNEEVMNFSMNRPEWKNQSEVAYAIMMNFMVDTVNKDENGNTIQKPLFDGKEFIYIPGTMQLKPEFDTESNRKMWVEFKQDDSGRDHAAALKNKIETAVKATQGNYAEGDQNIVNFSVLGKLLMQFGKWKAEHVNKQTGQQSVNINLGKLDIKGNKVVLMNHFPTAMMYTVLNGNKYVFSAVAAGASLTGLPFLGMVAAGGAAAVAIPLAVKTLLNYRSKKEIKKAVINMNEIRLAGNVGAEIIMGAVQNYADFFTYGKLKTFGDKIESLKTEEKALKLGLTHQDRLKLSENAREVSNKISLAFGSAITGLVIKFIMSLFGPPEDDDDEMKKKIWMEHNAKIEDMINKLINTRNNLTSSYDMFTSPEAFLNDMTTSAYLQQIKRTDEDVAHIIEGFTGEKPRDSKWLYKAITTIPGLSVNNTLGKVIATEKSNFADDRVYTKSSGLTAIIDSYLKGQTKTPDQALKSEADNKRAIIKSKVEDYFDDKIEEQDYYKHKILVEKEVKKYMKKYYKDEKESYEELLERMEEFDPEKDLE